MLTTQQRAKKFRDVFRSYNEIVIFNGLNPAAFRTRLGPYLKRGIQNQPFSRSDLDNIQNVADLLQDWENKSASATIGAMEDALIAGQLDDILHNFRNIVNGKLPDIPIQPVSSISPQPTNNTQSTVTEHVASVDNSKLPFSKVQDYVPVQSTNSGNILVLNLTGNDTKTYYIDLKNSNKYQDYINGLHNLLKATPFNELSISFFYIKDSVSADTTILTLNQFNDMIFTYINDQLTKTLM